MIYVLYDTSSGEENEEKRILDKREMTISEAIEKNDALRAAGISGRWIIDLPIPEDDEFENGFRDQEDSDRWTSEQGEQMLSDFEG